MADLVGDASSHVGVLRGVARSAMRSAARADPRPRAAPAPVAEPEIGVTVAARAELAQVAAWRTAFAPHAKDRRYYELVEDTIEPRFLHRYFLVTDAQGEACAVQPAFVADIDLFEGVALPLRRAADIVRRAWPRFMTTRALMIGCAAGDGHLDGADRPARRAAVGPLVAAALAQARADGARLLVFKEFSARYRADLAALGAAGFVRVPSLPMTSLDLNYASFEDYMARALSRAARKDLRRKFKAAARGPDIEMSVTHDAGAIIDEVYPLYLQVYERSHLHFEKLTKDYIRELGRRMPDRARFFVWRRDGVAVAFSICLVQGDTIQDEYLGLDYRVALDLHLYHVTFRDVVTWAIANGYRRYRSTGLNYDPKLHLRHRLEPLDLYVRATSGLASRVLKIVLPLLGPTRYDATLKRFANYHELTDAA